MGTVIDFLAFVVPAAVLVALVVVAVRTVGPFVDRTALFRAGPDDTAPRGVQEEDPDRWDFTGTHVGEPRGRPSVADSVDDPPATAPR
jgi:hypothetical protein